MTMADKFAAAVVPIQKQCPVLAQEITALLKRYPDWELCYPHLQDAITLYIKTESPAPTLLSTLESLCALAQPAKARKNAARHITKNTKTAGKTPHTKTNTDKEQKLQRLLAIIEEYNKSIPTIKT